MRISDWSSDVCFFRSLLLDIAADFRRVRKDQEGPVAHHAAHAGGQECWLAHERPILSDVCLDAEVEFRKFQHVTSTGADEVLTLAILHRLDRDRKSTRLNSSH